MASILLVEDNEMDELLSRRAISRAEVTCDVVVARDGAEAWAHLTDPKAQLPVFVLLDLKLPKLSGIQVLERIRRTKETSRIPVVIFTSSDEECDLLKCFELHANSYIRKTIDMDAYESQLKIVMFYWIYLNKRAH